MTDLPQPLPDPAEIDRPQDVEYPGIIRLFVDATDLERRIFQAHETIPVERAGPMTLLLPKWLPGYHAPQAQIELFAGLEITAAGHRVGWKRHPTEVYAFFVDIPEGAREVEARFQFLSPTDPSQGRVVVSPELLCLQWNTVVLYPAGHFSRRIQVEPVLKLPDNWQFGCALEAERTERGTVFFKSASLDVLIDSPVFAGRHFREIRLDDQVRLAIVADRPELLNATPEQVRSHSALVTEADALFGSRHFDRYSVLLALTEEVGRVGVEHQRSCETVTLPGYFSEWEATFSRRDSIPHEYTHSWNGKFRRGADSWSPSFERPIRNSLMWVYEGMTQYLGRVLCARSGLWTAEQTRGALAQNAATHDLQAGRNWRPLSDTTRDPIIAARSALPWPSWQRSEDYYSEGSLIWLDVDTRIREMSGDTRSLDDFARAFFGTEDGNGITRTYEIEELVQTLNDVVGFDWQTFLTDKLEEKEPGAPLDGLERGGYRLVYRGSPSTFWENGEIVSGELNMICSLGLKVSAEGTLTDVVWESPAFKAALTIGSQISEVNGKAYSHDELKRATAMTAEDQAITLLVKRGKRLANVGIPWRGGLRYPHLEKIQGARQRLDEILAPLTASLGSPPIGGDRGSLGLAAA
jgi:predicted metalloprotease with PDZ domain